MNRKIFLPLSILLLTVLACSIPTPAASTGIVQGVVYADLNSDGLIDDSEQSARVDSAEVTLADCGPEQTILTDLEGKFLFENLPTGTCQVSVSKGGWIYAGSFPDLGVYPIPVASDPDLPTSFSIYMSPVMDFIPTETPHDPDSTLLPTLTFTPSFTPTSALPMVSPLSEDVNCRYGPGVEWLTVGSLRTGEIVPIRGTIPGRTWWQIEDPRNLGSLCWVKADLTSTTGNLALVPVIAPPLGMVTVLTITTPAVLHGFCAGPNSTTFSVSITTNGPATVTYHLEIFNGDGSLRNSTGNSTRTFTSFGTQTFDPGGAYHTDCGDYYIKVIVTSPNNMTAQANWSVVYP